MTFLREQYSEAARKQDWRTSQKTFLLHLHEGSSLVVALRLSLDGKRWGMSYRRTLERLRYGMPVEVRVGTHSLRTQGK
jgi:hypothetical protein